MNIEKKKTQHPHDNGRTSQSQSPPHPSHTAKHFKSAAQKQPKLFPTEYSISESTLYATASPPLPFPPSRHNASVANSKTYLILQQRRIPSGGAFRARRCLGYGGGVTRRGPHMVQEAHERGLLLRERASLRVRCPGREARLQQRGDGESAAGGRRGVGAGRDHNGHILVFTSRKTCTYCKIVCYSSIVVSIELWPTRQYTTELWCPRGQRWLFSLFCVLFCKFSTVQHSGCFVCAKSG